MKELTVKGLVTVEGMKFHEIEGGFGEGKKSMLVKEIAEIHGRELKKINELINKNRKRFADNVDVIDIKTGLPKGLVLEMGFTNAQYGNAKNIYLLSERGYAKLLKILEDDLAWEQYDKLVDGYFNMRKVIKEKTAITEKHLKDMEKRLENKTRMEMETLVGGYQRALVGMQNQMIDFQKQQQDLMMNFQREMLNKMEMMVNKNNQPKKSTSSFNGGLLGISKIVEGTGMSAEKANIKLIEKGILYIDQNGDKVATDEAVALGIAENIEIKNKPGHYFAVYTTKGQKEVKKILGIEEFEQASFDNVINFKK